MPFGGGYPPLRPPLGGVWDPSGGVLGPLGGGFWTPRGGVLRVKIIIFGLFLYWFKPKMAGRGVIFGQFLAIAKNWGG